MRIFRSPDAVRLEACHGSAAEPDDYVHLTHEQRMKSRLLVRLDSGKDATIVMPRGHIMRGGDRLRSDRAQTVAIVAAPEPLLEARVNDAVALARAAYHLGNRHVAVEVRANALRLARDPVLGALLAQLGLQTEDIEAPFEPEAGAYGHSHAHLSSTHSSSAMIHEFHRHE